MFPGDAHSGSCRRHQADSEGVCANLRIYAGRDSKAAAHKRGIAANPRGTAAPPLEPPEGDELEFETLGVVWGVCGVVP